MSEGDLLREARVIWSYLMWWSHWLTGISSSRRSSIARLSRSSSPAMGAGFNLEGRREETAIGSMKLEGRERMRAVANVDVFEVEALGWYL